MWHNLINSTKLTLDSYRNTSFIKKFTIVFGIDVLVKASSFLLLPVYLRLMTQGEYGLYNYFFSIIQLFTLILNLGLYTSLSKYYHKYKSPDEKGVLLFTIAVTLSVFIFVFCLMAYFFRIDYWLIGKLFKDVQSYAKYRLVILFSLIVSVSSFMLTNFFYTSEKIQQVKRYNLSRIILVNVFTISALFLIKTDHVQTRLLATAICELALLLTFAYHFLKETVFRFSRVIMLTSLKMGLPIMVSAMFGIVINFSDKYFLEKYGNMQELSSYFLAFSFANILPFVFTSFQNIWLPVFLKESDSRRNFEKTQKVIYKLFLILLFISIILWVLLFVLLRFNIIQAKYSQALSILPLLAFAQILGPITTLYSNYLLYIEKTYVASITGFIVSVISITLGAILVPRFGVYGSALSVLFSYMCYLLLYYYWVRFEKRKMDVAIQWQQ